MISIAHLEGEYQMHMIAAIVSNYLIPIATTYRNLLHLCLLVPFLDISPTYGDHIPIISIYIHPLVLIECVYRFNIHSKNYNKISFGSFPFSVLSGFSITGAPSSFATWYQRGFESLVSTSFSDDGNARIKHRGSTEPLFSSPLQ